VLDGGGISASGRSWVIIDGFTIDPGGIQVGGATNTVVTHNRVRIGQIYATGSGSLLIAGNEVSDCASHGIKLRSVVNSVIEDNVCHDNANGIVFLADYTPATGNLIRRNRLYENSGSGLYFQSTTPNNLSVQNLMWGNEHGTRRRASGSPGGSRSRGEAAARRRRPGGSVPESAFRDDARSLESGMAKRSQSLA
jgi:parallel beta-helix repeat protein